MGDIVDIIYGGRNIKYLIHLSYNLQVSQLVKEQEAQGEEVPELFSLDLLSEKIAKVENSLCVSPPHWGQTTFSPTLQSVENL